VKARWVFTNVVPRDVTNNYSEFPVFDALFEPRGVEMQSGLELLLRRHVEAENAHHMEETLATLHEDCIFEDVATGQRFRGRRGAEAHYRQWWDAFGLAFSRDKEDHGYWTKSGAYVGQGRFQGVHIGTFLGIPATGNAVSFRFAVFVTFRDGLMAGEKFYYDLAAVLYQIGAIHWPLAVAALGESS
jgi:steroid delta-isomerase-like uncharacterized protein